MRHVLAVYDQVEIADALLKGLRTAGLGVDCATSEFEAYRRLAGLPTVRAVIIEQSFGDGRGAEEVARFARRVIPGVALIYVDGRAQRGGMAALSADMLRCPPPAWTSRSAPSKMGA